MRKHWKVGSRPGAVKRRIVLAVMVAGMMLLPAVGSAEQASNLVKNGDAETGDLTNWQRFSKVVSEDPHSGKFCLSRQGNAMVLSREFIPIDPDKTYTLTGWFKSVGTGPSLLYLGYVPYDEKKRRISAVHVRYIPGSETSLFEACDKTDTLIKIVDGAKWQTMRHVRIAFEADDSGNYEDLPNRKLSTPGITKVENMGDHWEIHLKKPCAQSYAAGTKVREHMSGGAYIYNAAGNKKVPAEWTKYTGRIKGMAKTGMARRQWWRGTKYARILLLANYKQSKEFELLADDISMTESAK